jgi:thioredoxin-related protein
VAEAPELDRFYRDETPETGFLAVAVGDTEAAMRALVTQSGYSFPVMLGSDDLASQYGVQVIPTHVIIDPEGRVVKTIVGGVTAAELSEVVDDLTS